jgi:hypothetical protein
MKWPLSFQPFIIRELINQGLASNMKIAKNLIQQNETIIDPVLKVIPFSKPSAITQIRDSSI